MRNYVRLMRVHHCIKNLLVFAALACSGQLFVGEKFLAATVGFAAFCMLSSAVYIINDIRDRDADRLSPERCGRPIASGAVPLKNAWALAAALIIGAGAVDLLAFRPASALLLLLYLVLNIAYSYGLKHIPILDVTILVSGFLIRILYGAAITGITVSNWLYLTVISMAFYFALGKRRNEMERSETAPRKVLRYYSREFLDKNMYMCLALANVFYALWSMDEKTIELYGSDHLVATVPIVLLICMKYSLDIENGSSGDPVEVLLHDRALIALCAVYLAVMLMMLYL